MKKFIQFLAKLFRANITKTEVIFKDRIVEVPVEVIKEIIKEVEVIKEVFVSFDSDINGSVAVAGNLTVKGYLFVEGEVTCYKMKGE